MKRRRSPQSHFTRARQPRRSGSHLTINVWVWVLMWIGSGIALIGLSPIHVARMSRWHGLEPGWRKGAGEVRLRPLLTYGVILIAVMCMSTVGGCVDDPAVSDEPHHMPVMDTPGPSSSKTPISEDVATSDPRQAFWPPVASPGARSPSRPPLRADSPPSEPSGGCDDASCGAG